VTKHPDWLTAFADESNKIEGMAPARMRELEALADFIAHEAIGVPEVETYVKKVAPGHRLRRVAGLNVRVGEHVAPLGGPEIETKLAELLADLPINHPYKSHVAYETLHPFTDGNGRSGRAIWLWQHLHFGHAGRAQALGFLHSFYYETLQFSDERRPD
jgi:hypothetical protein